MKKSWPKWMTHGIVLVLVHAIFMVSIFDIYFRTPLIHGMDPMKSTRPALSERVVLIVGDGCRADMFFEYDNTRESRESASLAPYLRGIVEEHGVWGVSHTRVPTESRPGHVALLAGIYEDVSAVTTGWKANPVDFDHLFHQSSHAWGYGSPDIMPMFAMTAPQMEYECYEKDAEDFASDGSRLDTWTFDKVEALFEEANTNQTLAEVMKQPQTVFFLHLLGLDNNGHAFRPRSLEYANNIRLVDRGVKKTVKMMEDFFGDGKTAYVFTADHGMSDRGNHGDGDKDCTRTPLVVWGPSVRKAQRADKESDVVYTDPVTPEQWHLDGVRRRDVNQADVAPLMAHLAGVTFPVNSVGVLPVDMLAGSDEDRAHAVFANMRQHLQNLKRKGEVKRASSHVRFVPFSRLVSTFSAEEEVASLIESGRFQEAISRSFELIDLALEGLRYYQTYDWFFLMSVVSLGYVGCILYVSGFLIREGSSFADSSSLPSAVRNSKVKRGETGISVRSEAGRRPRPAQSSTSAVLSWIFTGSIGAGLFVFLLLQGASWLYFCYVSLTVFVWERVFEDVPLWCELGRRIVSDGSFWRLLAAIAPAFAIGEVLVVMFYHREGTALVLVSFAVWGLLQDGIPLSLRACWSIFCVLSCIFTSVLPIDVGKQLWLVNISAMCLLLFPLFALVQYYAPRLLPGWARGIKFMFIQSRRHSLIVWWLFGLHVHAWALVNVSSYFIGLKTGLPKINSILAYAQLLLAIGNLFILPRPYVSRIVFIGTSLGSPLLLLSVSYESLFFFVFVCLLVCWVVMEQMRLLGRRNSSGTDSPAAARPSRERLRIDHVRTGAFFLFFLFLGLFGAGNVASATSFELSSCYRFTTQFDPFWMSGLLAFKIFVPFVLVGCAFDVICRQFLRVPGWAVAFIALTVSDVASLNFFFRVSDEGSWLDIGQSITHFAIMNFMAVGLLALLLAARPLVVNVSLSLGKDRKFE